MHPPTIAFAVLLTVAQPVQTPIHAIEPRVVKAVIPIYPPLWRIGNISGMVWVKVHFDLGGNFEKVEIESSKIENIGSLQKYLNSMFSTWKFVKTRGGIHEFGIDFQLLPYTATPEQLLTELELGDYSSRLIIKAKQPSPDSALK